jgi:hypothetical protein
MPARCRGKKRIIEFIPPFMLILYLLCTGRGLRWILSLKRREDDRTERKRDPYMKHHRWLWPCLLVLLLVGFALALRPAYSQEFSAEQTTITPTGKEVSTLFYRPDGWRVEPKGGRHTDISIFRLDKKIIWVLLPKEKRFMEAPLTEEDMPLPARIPGEIDRKVVGQEEVEGFACDKLSVRYSKGEEIGEMTFWVSRQLKVPLRSEAPDMGWKSELKMIKVGPQPNGLFELPPDYTFFNPPMEFFR